MHLQTGISWACAYNSLIAVKTLIKFDGTDLNTPDNEGNTPLMVAAQAGKKTVFFLPRSDGEDSSFGCPWPPR